jgi:hypothetical protein
MSTEDGGDDGDARSVERPALAAVLVVLAWAAVVYARYLAGYLH